jgi:hypothetical protein
MGTQATQDIKDLQVEGIWHKGCSMKSITFENGIFKVNVIPE